MKVRLLFALALGFTGGVTVHWGLSKPSGIVAPTLDEQELEARGAQLS